MDARAYQRACSAPRCELERLRHRQPRVELDASTLERRKNTRRRDEDTRAAGGLQRVDVAGAEVHGVAARELVPGKRVVVAAWLLPRAEDRDRPLPHLVEIREAAPLRLLVHRGVELEADALDLDPRASPDLVGAERGEEQHRVGEMGELDPRPRAAARR